MREIRYRAFDKEKGEMFIVTEIRWVDGRVWGSNALSGDGCYAPATQVSDILLEDTGLLDKNGKEIWEGDVLENGSTIGVVEFGDFECDTGFEGHAEDFDVIQAFYMRTQDGNQNVGGEVIGNIYEHPNLLNQSK